MRNGARRSRWATASLLAFFASRFSSALAQERRIVVWVFADPQSPNRHLPWRRKGPNFPQGQSVIEADAQCAPKIARAQSK